MDLLQHNQTYGRIISITPYNQDVGFTNLIRTQKENFDWQMDCENGRLPFSLCNSVSR
jgi:hypothetical protein